MIDIEEHELGPAFMRSLKVRLDILRQALGLTPALADAVQTELADLRQDCKFQGIDFPEMRLLILPKINQMFIVRADLDRKGIETQVVNIVTQYPTTDMRELAFAVKIAFPDFRPERRELLA